MAIKINGGYDTTNGNTVESVVAELVKAHGRDVVSTITDLTDSSGGTPDTSTYTLLAASTDLVNAANASTNLAQKASAETNLTLVKDALLELATKANEYSTKLGRTSLTYNGGGTAVDGTVAAIGVAVTAATTGAQATETNALLAVLNNAFYTVGVQVNKLCVSTGVAPLVLTALTTSFSSTVAAITVGTGTAADPGITKVALDAELVKLRTNVATIAAKLNALNAGIGNAAVVAV